MVSREYADLKIGQLRETRLAFSVLTSHFGTIHQVMVCYWLSDIGDRLPVGNGKGCRGAQKNRKSEEERRDPAEFLLRSGTKFAPPKLSWQN